MSTEKWFFGGADKNWDLKSYKKYKNSNDKAQYHRAFGSEILLFDGARKKLGKPITTELIDSTGEVEKQIKALMKEKEILIDERNKIKKDLKELNSIKSNIDNFMKSGRQYISRSRTLKRMRI